MRYITVENNIPKDYSIEQLLIDQPDAVIYKKTKIPNEELLANYNVYPLITEAQPGVNEDETVEESAPEFRQGEWHQAWRVRKLTDAEIQEIIKSGERFLAVDNVDSNETVTGFIASVELQKHRYEICKSCDSFTALKTCRVCGCIMPLKIKIATASCPLEKW
jgi:hypothetical protein